MAGETYRTYNGKVIHIDWFWRDLLRRLENDTTWRSAFVSGPVDSGKSTLCRLLGEHLAKRYRTATIDCDPGQSVLSPPTTLALAWEPWKNGRTIAMRFVGSTTPAGHFLQTLTGMKRLADRALEEGAEKVVFDSCGYSSSGIGREFFHQSLDLIGPDYLIALQHIDEMESLLASFLRRSRPRLLRLPISEAVTNRNRTERRRYRQEKFREYFEGASAQTLPLEGIGLHGMIPPFTAPDSWRNRLIALCDRDGFTAVLGILEEINLRENRFVLYAPAFEREEIASVQFGSLRLNRSGEELWDVESTQ